MARKSHELKIDGGRLGKVQTKVQRHLLIAGRNGILIWRDSWSGIF